LAQEAAASDTKKLVQEKERGTIAIQIAKKKKKTRGGTKVKPPADKDTHFVIQKENNTAISHTAPSTLYDHDKKQDEQ